MAITGIQDRTDLSRRESFASATTPDARTSSRPNGRADVAARGDDDEDDVFVYDQAGDFDLHPRAQ